MLSLPRGSVDWNSQPGRVYTAEQTSLPRGSVDWNSSLRGVYLFSLGRSREGAWIEIWYAPSCPYQDCRRSREGAWIEIIKNSRQHCNADSRSREGAWIEMRSAKMFFWAFSGRSREGAWIEIGPLASAGGCFAVAPARERGLKSLSYILAIKLVLSLPRGSVDWNRVFAV